MPVHDPLGRAKRENYRRVLKFWNNQKSVTRNLNRTNGFTKKKDAWNFFNYCLIIPNEIRKLPR